MSDVRGPQIGLPERVHEFVVACTTDDLTDDHRTAFEQLLRESDDACRLYLKCVDISVALPSILSAIPDEESPYDISFLKRQPNTLPSAPAAPRGMWHGMAAYFSSGWPVAYLIATVVVSVGLITAAFMHVSRNEGPASQYSSTVGGHPTARESNTEIVGRITGMLDCQWADPQAEAFDGTNVPLGRKYALSSGLMEITYDTGAKVILQGPVSFEVESINGGFLSVGKLTGKVEVEKAKGFSVRTPTATVTDLGTEFGVEVVDGGKTQVHVFRGIVEARIAGHDADSQRREQVTEGHAIEIGRDDKSIRAVAVAPQSFVRKVRSPVTGLARFPYAAAVLGDNPISYWRLGETGRRVAFDWAKASARPQSHAKHGTGADGVILGGVPGALLGDPDRAATFNGTNAITIYDSAPLDFEIGQPFTIEAWIKTTSRSDLQGIVSKYDSSGGFFLGTADLRDGLGSGPHLQIDTPNGGIYKHAGGDLNDGRWHHLAATYSGGTTSDSLALFIDGKRIASKVAQSKGKLAGSIRNSVPLHIGDRNSDRPFVGAIDEVAVYGWAMDDRTIASHFHAATSAGPATLAGSDGESAFIAGVTATASTEQPRVRSAQNTVDGSGFDAATCTVTSTNQNTMWNTDGTADTKANTWIMFDLGTVQEVGQMWVYNYNYTHAVSRYQSRRFVTADVWYSVHDVTTRNPTDANPGGWTKLVSAQQFTEAPYSVDYNTPTKIPMNVPARYVVLNNIVNGGVPTDGDNTYGLSEVIFRRPVTPSGNR
jgi:hypothetical protein